MRSIRIELPPGIAADDLPQSTAFVAARQMLRLLVGLTGLLGSVIAAMFVASFVFEAQLVAEFASRPTGLEPSKLVSGLRVFMLLGALMVPLLYILFSKLAEVVAAVADGAPFADENASRMSVIAWSLLAVQIVDLGFGAMAAMLSSENGRIEWTFSITGAVAVLLLFVLARVFAQGARMRRELERTV